MKDYYYILGISENATLDDIKFAYRKLSKKFHPDLNSGEKFFEERFKELQEAYAILSNDQKRSIYDNNLKLFKSKKKSNDDYDLLQREEKLKKEKDEFEKQKREFEQSQKETAQKRKKEEFEQQQKEEELRNKEKVFTKDKEKRFRQNYAGQNINHSPDLPFLKKILIISKLVNNTMIVFIFSVLLTSFLSVFQIGYFFAILAIILGAFSLFGFIIIAFSSFIAFFINIFIKNKYSKGSYHILISNLISSFKYVSPLLLGPFSLLIFNDILKYHK